MKIKCLFRLFFLNSILFYLIVNRSYSYFSQMLKLFKFHLNLYFSISFKFYNNFNNKIKQQMQSSHQYFVKTKTGKIQLSKGAYLTILKRKASTLKTLKKTKKIHHLSDYKKTVKKIFRDLNQKESQTLNFSPDVFQEQFRPQTKDYGYDMGFLTAYEDNQIFSMKSIPNIDMQWDNDCDSQWFQIGNGVTTLKYSLSMAVLDSIHF